MATTDEWLAHMMGDMTDKRMDEVFALVQPADNWKLPVNATVPKTAATAEELERAVVFFTGGRAEVTANGDQWVVTAPGYYASVGA